MQKAARVHVKPGRFGACFRHRAGTMRIFFRTPYWALLLLLPHLPVPARAQDALCEEFTWLDTFEAVGPGRVSKLFRQVYDEAAESFDACRGACVNQRGDANGCAAFAFAASAKTGGRNRCEVADRRLARVNDAAGHRKVN